MSQMQEVPLSSLTTLIQYGYTAKSSSTTKGPKYLRITDIQNDRVDWDNVPRVTADREAIDRYRLKPGDIVFARSGATVGKSFLIRDDPGEAVFASYLIRVQCAAERLDPEYAALFFRSADYWNQIREGASGIGQPNFNGTKLADLRIPILPINGQRKLVATLKVLLNGTKGARDELSRAANLLDRLEQATLDKAFRGDLMPVDTQFTIERRKVAKR